MQLVHRAACQPEAGAREAAVAQVVGADGHHVAVAAVHGSMVHGSRVGDGGIEREEG